MNGIYLNLNNSASLIPQFLKLSFSKISSIAKIIFSAESLYLGFGLSYCCYNLYQGYKFKYYPAPFVLNDRMKLTQCRVLLNQVKETQVKEIKKREATANQNPKLQEVKKDIANANEKSKLQECKDLLATVSPGLKLLYIKKNLYLELAEYCAESDPEQAFQFAEQLTDSYDLFKIAALIRKKDPNSPHIFDLCKKAFLAHKKEMEDATQKSRIFKPSLKDVERFLSFADAFNTLNNDELRSSSVDEALKIIKSFDNPFTKFQAYCLLAQSSHNMKLEYSYTSSLYETQHLFKEIESVKDIKIRENVILAHLILADTFLSLGEHDKMNNEIAQAYLLFKQTKDEDYELLTFIVHPWAKILKKTADKNLISIPLKNSILQEFQKRENILPSISMKNMSLGNQASAYLRIANAYHELVQTKKSLNFTRKAFNLIKDMPHETSGEITSKAKLLIQIIDLYKTFSNDEIDTTLKDVHEIIGLLETLYDKSSFQDAGIYDKTSLGMFILNCYKEMKLADKSDVFFKRYLTDLKNSKTEASDKIIELTRICSHFSNYLESRHLKIMLEEAEELFSKVAIDHSQYAQMLSAISENYLKIDSQKSAELIESYKIKSSKRIKEYRNKLGNKHFIKTTVYALSMGICNFSPIRGTTLVTAGFCLTQVCETFAPLIGRLTRLT